MFFKLLVVLIRITSYISLMGSNFIRNGSRRRISPLDPINQLEGLSIGPVETTTIFAKHQDGAEANKFLADTVLSEEQEN